MPPENQQPEKEPLEKLKDLIGFKWSTMIAWLVALIPASFGLGITIGMFVANSNNNFEMNKLILQHQKEVYEAKEAGKTQANEDMKKTKDEAQYIIDIIEKGQKK